MITNIAVLILANFVAYHYDLGICKLCYYQQFITLLIIISSIAALIFSNNSHKILGVLVTLFFLANTSISTYQVMLQEGLIESSSSCTGTVPSKSADFNNYKNQILTNDITPCEHAVERFLGISLAGYNLIFSFSMLLFSLIFNGVFIFSKTSQQQEVNY